MPGRTGAHCNSQNANKYDQVFVQEKLDGSNVGVARIGDSIYPLGRAGYLTISSSHEQHRHFSN